MTYGGKLISASSNPTNDLPSLISFFNYFIFKWNFPTNVLLSAKIRRRRIRPGRRQRRRLKKQTNLIPNKHPSPILVLHQFPYFPIREVHSKVEVAHPNLQQKKGGVEAKARAKAKCERAFIRDSRFVKGVKGGFGKTYE